jgi:alkylation response protein AidB-like acyl-CoA dehydrogenase
MNLSLARSAPTEERELSFSHFLQAFKQRLEQVFHQRADLDRLSVERGLPPFVLRDIMSDSPFRVFVPTELGGRGADIAEGVALVEAASYESLSLALMFGINWALFIQPVRKYADKEVRQRVLGDLLRQRKMGGLMITEPDFGSDALHMQTSWSEQGDDCHLQGIKHWAGLTGWADYWLLTARKRVGAEGLARDIDFFICDTSQPEQQVVVEEKFHNLGLYMLPYGRNRIDVRVPAVQRLIPHSTGIKMMLDLLHRSRLNFPSMAMGFLHRILDEATDHCRQRMVGGRSLFSYDQVQARLARLQSAFTICSAMCINTCERAGLERDLSLQGLEANAIKTCVTDLMQSAAQSLVQLVGAKGYRLDHFAGRALVDSRPFQIFEGSNDILYIQISETLLKQMKVQKETNLQHFLKGAELTRRAAERLEKLFDFVPDFSMSQRKLAELGRIFSRVVALNLVLGLEERGFDRELVAGSSSCLTREIASRLNAFVSADKILRRDPEQKLPSWLEYR